MMRSKEWLAFYRGLAERDLTIADLETTGFKPPLARVTEISVIQASLRDGVRSQETRLINSNTIVPEQITRFTGITQAMVDRAPDAEAVWTEFFPWLNQGVLVCHNLEFDYPFMRSELDRFGMAFEKPIDQQCCTVILSRLMLPDLPSRSLPNLVQHFRFDVGRSHRAEADTMACWLLLERLLMELMDTDDETLLQRFGRQWLSDRDAAKLMGRSKRAAVDRLTQFGARMRKVGKGNTIMFQRSEIEAAIDEDAGWIN